MARLARSEIFSPDEITHLHLMARVVRRCYLLGDDSVTGKNYDHRNVWIEEQLVRLAAHMGIDLLGFSMLSNHFYLVVRTRPDVVAIWDDTEVARRWLTLCPLRICAGGPAVISESDLNSLRNDPAKVREIRSRLSDPSWWMRMLCQRIATKANDEDKEVGKFFQAKYRAVKLLDESAILACAVYVDLNPTRAGLAETLEESEFTSVQRRIAAMAASTGDATRETPALIDNLSTRPRRADRLLSPILLDELRDPLGPHPSCTADRCSDKGFLPISQADYLSLLDWTAP
jgi:hypothetical protein